MHTQPSRKAAARGISIKAFMPLLYDKLAMFFGKLARLSEFVHLEAERLSELNRLFYGEDCLAATVANVDMNRAMIVAVKKETIAVLLEDCGHPLDCRPAGDSTAISFYRS